MNSYHHLSPEDRAVIMIMLKEHCSLRQIASKLNRSPSTISRELTRNAAKSYNYVANKAARSYKERRLKSVKPDKLQVGSPLYDIVHAWIIDHKWSPEQISNKLKQSYPKQPSMQVSPETIYAHIYAHPKGELKKLMVSSLRRHKSKRGPRGSKNSNYSSLKVSEEQLIMNRPVEVETREIAGHWEGDLIVGAMNKSCVGTLVERKTGYLVMSKMQNKTAQAVREGFEANMKTIQDFLRISLTYDRGSEMAQHPQFSKNLQMKVYFADPHSPWQRGSSENINGLIRQFLPKGEDLSIDSQSDLDYIANLLNTRPRKRYGFRSPQEMMEQELDGGLIRVALDS